ncbi:MULTISPECIES: hypothetical protein [unclassified Psychrobacter]|uniref:hypothetical protein n=1 Tax=unclassified Psychrobacter TaxID=196806 RepID=UPI003FD534ED
MISFKNNKETIVLEYSPYHVANLLFALTDDSLEHHLKEEYEDYYDADFKDQEQLLKWLNRLLYKIDKETNQGYKLYKTSLRKIIHSNETVPIDIYLPGIEEVDDWYVAYNKFLLNLWSYLFDEDYVAIDGLTYIERIDEEFVNFPHMPELWKTPRYKGC